MEDYKTIYQALETELKEKFAKVKLICLDFDGVLTDNLVVHAQDGTESVVRSRADTMGLDMLREAQIYKDDGTGELDIVIMSRETNPVVSAVAKKIKVRCMQSQYKKFEAFKEEVRRRELNLEAVMFVGNDYNDLSCVEHVVQGGGLGVAVADSYLPLKKIANYTTASPGGGGALREICELILYARSSHPL